MNKDRRERLDTICGQLQDMAFEEQNFIDTMSDETLESEPGNQSDQFIKTMDKAIQSIKKVIK